MYTRGDYESSLCLTCDQPDQVRLKIFGPNADRSESRVGLNGSLPEGGRVLVGVEFGRNSLNLAENWANLAKIRQIWLKTSLVWKDLAGSQRDLAGYGEIRLRNCIDSGDQWPFWW